MTKRAAGRRRREQTTLDRERRKEKNKNEAIGRIKAEEVIKIPYPQTFKLKMRRAENDE